MTGTIRGKATTWLVVVGAAALLPLFSIHPSMAQGLDSEQAIDTIVGSDVQTGEKEAAADPERILAAIGETRTNISEVRRRFSLDGVELVFLTDLGEPGTGINAAIEENAEAIEELRVSIEGSAMFYHAIASRSVMLRDVIAVEFDDANGVTIFIAGTDPAR